MNIGIGERSRMDPWVLDPNGSVRETPAAEYFNVESDLDD